MTDRILKFSAKWCLPCRTLATQLEGIDLGVPIENVDIEEQYDVARKFIIRSVPTLIYMKGESEAGRKVGGVTLDQIKEWVDTLK